MKYSCSVTVCTSPTDSSRLQPLIIGFGSSENNSPPRANAVWRRRTRGEIIATAPASVRPRGSPKVRERSRYSLADTARASSEPPRAASVAPWLIPDAGEQRGRFVAHRVRPFPPSGNPRAMRSVTRPGGGRSTRRRHVRSCAGASEARGARVRCSRRLRRASRRGDGSPKLRFFFRQLGRLRR